MTQFVRLPDGDQIALEVSTPPYWQPTDRTVILLHGLCGCHGSPYMIRLASKFCRRGIRTVRMNMRGCGSGFGFARQPYHSGRSDDVQAVLDILHQKAPRSPTTAIGFSLGGNVLLKWAGESRAIASDYLNQVIAVCPPADLAACVRLFAQPSNRIYAWRFMRLLKAAVMARQALFSDSVPVSLPKRVTLYEFDNLYTAPQCGFHDADDYYARCGAAPLVPQITLPCRILFAADDPLIDVSMFDHVTLPPNVQVCHTARGGHLGFLGMPGLPGGYRWMDAQLLAWTENPLIVSSPPLGTDGDRH
jgi:predicted alpha/beta-fold hydrolase